jgi:ribonuclease HII
VDEPAVFRLGIDENGLGARLGPLVVTGVLARVSSQGKRTLSRKLPKGIRADLDDSKRLISHADSRLGEAWARALANTPAASPAALLEALLLEDKTALHAPCPSHVVPQCWGVEGEAFEADDALCQRTLGHRQALEARGVTLLSVRSSVVCTKRLNQARDRGVNRFVADLHAMESLVLELRREAASDVHAICGKVGGIAEYGKFFGPLAGNLHAVLEEGAARSAYRMPGVGELHFVRDADASDPLVMLASLVGKYVRELLMARIARFYPAGDDTASPSGYHDPVSAAFVVRTAGLRKRRKVPDVCFERARDPIEQLARQARQSRAPRAAGEVGEASREQLPLWGEAAKP